VKVLASFVLGLTLFAFAAFAEEFKGFIADDHCDAKDPAKVTSASHHDCAENCIKKGAKAVLVTPDNKIYKLDNQKEAIKHAGHEVTVNGKLKGDTIQVSSIKM
jgi:hypothetical protein